MHTNNALPDTPSWKKRLYRWFVAPADSVVGRENRRSARVLIVTLLIALPLLFIPETIRALSRPEIWSYFAPATVALLIAYVISRTRYFRVATWMLLLTFVALPVAALVQTPDIAPEQVSRTLFWILPTLVLASVLLRPADLMVFAVSAVGMILFLPVFVPKIFMAQLSFPFALIVVTTSWLFIGSWLRRDDFLELDRRANEIERTNQFLENVMNSLDNPFYVVNVADYSIELANDAAQALGLSGNRTCYALTHNRAAPCDGVEHPCPLKQVRASKSPYTAVHLHHKPDGSTYYAEVHGYPILDDDGNVVQMIEYSLDITARQEAENELRKLHQAVEQSAAPIVITDARGVIEYVNLAFTEVTGYTREETLGKDTSLLKSGEHPAALYKEMWATIQRGDIWRGELVNRRKDGSTYIEEQVITPVKDAQGVITHYVAVKQDITARKAAEETIRKLSQAVEQSASTIVITDKDGDIEYVNPAFSRATGYSIEEALGQNPRILKSGKMSPEFYQEMWDTLVAGKMWSGEMINKKKNGELYWEFATIAPVTDENGEITHYIAVKDDITKRKAMETELLIARDQAVAGNRLKGRILANVSHDMRTPLGSILGYSDMLKAGVFGPLNETQQEKLARIIQSTNHLLEFVNNLLSQSDLESGSLVLQKNPISLPAFAQELEDRFRVLIEGQGLTFTQKLDPALPATILGDRYWLNRIIANLVSNAVKFTPKGSVRLGFQRVGEAHWAVEVSDTGVGILPEELSQIFEPFQKGSNKNMVSSGAGLGLAIVKQVVEQMGGRISVNSVVEQGSAFTILLPLQIPEEQTV